MPLILQSLFKLDYSTPYPPKKMIFLVQMNIVENNVFFEKYISCHDVSKYIVVAQFIRSIKLSISKMCMLPSNTLFCQH